MKINVSRRQELANRPDSGLALDLSVKVAQNMANVMQLIGLETVRLAQSDSLGESRMVHGDHAFFQETPSGLVKATEPTIPAICSLLASFGVTAISLTPDEGDMQTLSTMWLSMMQQRRQEQQEQPQESDPEPADMIDPSEIIPDPEGDEQEAIDPDPEPLTPQGIEPVIDALPGSETISESLSL